MRMKNTPAPIPLTTERAIVGGLCVFAMSFAVISLAALKCWPSLPVDYVSAKLMSLVDSRAAAVAAAVEATSPIRGIVKGSAVAAAAVAVIWTRWVLRSTRRVIHTRGKGLDSDAVFKRLNGHSKK